MDNRAQRRQNARINRRFAREVNRLDGYEVTVANGTELKISRPPGMADDPRFEQILNRYGKSILSTEILRP